MTDQVAQLRQARMALLIAFDTVCWVAGFALVWWLVRLSLSGLGPESTIIDALVVGLAAGVLYVLVGLAFQLHQGRAAVASFDEIMLMGVNLLFVVGALFIAQATVGPFFRNVVLVLAPAVSVLFMFGGRAVYRLARDAALDQRPRSVDAARRVVVMGAGNGGRQLLDSMFRHPRNNLLAVALLDDDNLKRHRRIRGVQVKGRFADLADVVAETKADLAVLAVPSADASTVRAAHTLAQEAGVELKVLPAAEDLFNPGKVSIKDVRDINVTDLLGRHQIDTDVSSIAGYLTGKRVLVTGAGGSIGSELCRQIAAFKPAELMMLDRDESALHAVELSIYGKAMLDTDETVLGDIRDTEFINTLFKERRPEVVFHAAALKHLPLLEKAPGEAVKTNVWGTLTILEAAKEYGVEKFVNISTDKAANPCSVLGYSKRLAEGLTAHIAQEADGTYLSVRFGNVLGSRGSVLTAFAQQIAKGGPVTVTDPGVTRFFMTIAEACQLVIQAGAIGSDGEVLILDMGDAVSIQGVAEQLIELSGQEIDIVHTGLREGEKMHEELFGDHEQDVRRQHPLISHSEVPAYDALEARALDAWAEPAGVTFALDRACADMLSSLATDSSTPGQGRR